MLDSATSEAVNRACVDFVAHHDVPGISVSVRQELQELDLCLGFADLIARTPVSPDTRFSAGSITKQFVAVGTLVACEQAGIDINASVAPLLGGARCLHPTISIRHLLSHTSGIRSHLEFELVERADSPLTLPELLRRVSLERSHELPGLSWFYSNVGYALLGHLLERITGRELSAYLSQTLLEPIGLRHSAFIGGIAEHPRVAVGYSKGRNGHSSVELPSAASVFGSGSLVSTASDLAAWGHALWLDHLFGDNATEEMTRPVTLAGGAISSYGLGTYVNTYEGWRELSHDGNSAGFSSQLAIYPAAGLIISVLSNSSRHLAESLEKRIAQIILGIPHADFGYGDSALGDLSRLVGTYRYGATPVQIQLHDDGLMTTTAAGRIVHLVPSSTDIFLDADDTSTEYHFEATVLSLTLTIRRHGKTLAILSAP